MAKICIECGILLKMKDSVMKTVCICSEECKEKRKAKLPATKPWYRDYSCLGVR